MATLFALDGRVESGTGVAQPGKLRPSSGRPHVERQRSPDSRRPAVSPGCDLGRSRRQLRALLRERHQGRAVPVRHGGRARDRAHRAARVHRRGLARLPAGRAPGHGLRLSRARALRARRGTPLQSQQAADRSLCQAARRRSSSGGPSCSATRSARRTRTCRSTSATARRSCRSAGSIDPAFTWGARQAPGDSWERTIVYEMHVQGFTEAASAGSGGAPRHLRGSGASRGPRVHQEPRRHGGRAPAHPRVHRRQLPARARADELLGLQLASASSRPNRATSRRATSRSSRRWSTTCTPPASR